MVGSESSGTRRASRQRCLHRGVWTAHTRYNETMQRRTVVSVVFLIAGALIGALHVASLAGLISDIWKRPALLMYIGACVGISLVVCLFMDVLRRRKSKRTHVPGKAAAAPSVRARG